MKKRILLYTAHKNHYTNWLQYFSYYMAQKYELHWEGHPLDYDPTLIDITEYDHVFIWNGFCPISSKLRNKCLQLGVPITHIECGWFGQAEHYYLDRCGIGAQSQMMQGLKEFPDALVNKYLDWVLRRLNLTSVTKNRRGSEYILIPLQLEADTAIRVFSPYKTMQDFVDFIANCDEYKNERIILKPHPLDPHPKLDLPKNVTIDYSVAPVTYLAWKYAKKVVGINSTSLFETALLGIETKPYGDGLLKCYGTQGTDFINLIANMIDRQITVWNAEIGYWIKEYTTLEK